MTRNCILCAVSALALTTGELSARTLTISSWTGEKHPFSVDYADFVERIEARTNGEISFDLYVGGSLLPVNAALEGVRDGVTDIVNNIGAYTPADLPINNLLNDIAFAGSNSVAAGIAMTEMSLLNPHARAEWDSHGVVFINGWSTPVYYLACMPEVETFADLEGLRLRTAGGTHVEWAKYAGGIPVSVPFTDVYSGLQRGSIDCVMMNASDMGEGFQIGEVVNNYIMLPMGTHTSGAQYILNRDTWADFSAEDRAMLLDEFARQLVRFQLNYLVLEEAGMAFAREHGVKILEPDPTMTAAIATFKDDYYAKLPVLTEEKRGIPADQAKQIMDEYLAIYEKWTGLLESVGANDEEAITALVRREITEKLDAARFGL